MSAFSYSIIAVLIVSLISLVGVSTLLVSLKNIKRFSLLLVALATGTLIGDVFFHILPEISENFEFNSTVGIACVVGLMSFFILEKFLHWHHCHNPEAEHHPHPIAVNNLLADGIHNFIDGIIIGASFLISTEVGIATTIAVILHEIPQELGDFGVLIHSGLSKVKALLLNFFSGLLALAGTILTFLLQDKIANIEVYLLAFAAGTFLYLALADLVPEIKEESSLKHNILQLALVLVGLALMFGLTMLE